MTAHMCAPILVLPRIARLIWPRAKLPFAAASDIHAASKTNYYYYYYSFVWSESGNGFCVASLAATDFDCYILGCCGKPREFDVTIIVCAFVWMSNFLGSPSPSTWVPGCDGVKRLQFIKFTCHLFSQVKLVDVEKVEWLNRRSYSAISLFLGREGRVLLRAEHGLEDWFELLEVSESRILNCSNESENNFAIFFFASDSVTGMCSDQQRASSCIAYHTRSKVTGITCRTTVSFIIADKSYGTRWHLFECSRRLATHPSQTVRQFGEQSFPTVRFGARSDRFQRKQLHDEHFHESFSTTKNSIEQ